MWGGRGGGEGVVSEGSSAKAEGSCLVWGAAFDPELGSASEGPAGHCCGGTATHTGMVACEGSPEGLRTSASEFSGMSFLATRSPSHFRNLSVDSVSGEAALFLPAPPRPVGLWEGVYAVKGGMTFSFILQSSLVPAA